MLREPRDVNPETYHRGLKREMPDPDWSDSPGRREERSQKQRVTYDDVQMLTMMNGAASVTRSRSSDGDTIGPTFVNPTS